MAPKPSLGPAVHKASNESIEIPHKTVILNSTITLAVGPMLGVITHLSFPTVAVVDPFGGSPAFHAAV